MPNTLTWELTFDLIDCGECHVQFALERSHHQELKRNGTYFWCPNGHHILYRENTVTKLQAELDQVKASRDYAERRANRWKDNAEAEKRQHSATKGQLTKTKKRVAKGICPCCNRSFVNLANHMEGQHPDYVEGTNG